MIISYNSGIIFSKFNANKKTIVENVSFELDEKQSLGLIGETGSGKTIIASSIMKLLPKDVGTKDTKIIFGGKDISNTKNIKNLLGNKIVYIPQSGKDALCSNLSIRSHFINILKKNHFEKKDFERIIIEKLSLVGFAHPEEIISKYPFELSGGMAQKIVISLASCSSPSLILADEMTNGIAEDEKYEKINLINNLFPNASKIFITHDISIARCLDKILVLNSGKTVEQGRADIVLNNPHHPYTKALLASLPENGLNTFPLLTKIKGYCPFYQRCTRRKDKCLTSVNMKKENDITWFCNYG